MDKSLEAIAKIIQDYEEGHYISLDGLRIILRELSVHNYHLSRYNVEYYQKYNAIIFNRGADSVASAKVKADEEVPELRMLRKIMDAIAQVIWSVRSEISIIKNEN